MDIGALVGLMQYLPFTQVPGLLNGLPTSFNMKLFYVEETCENFGKDFPHCRPFFDPNLENHFSGFWSELCLLNNYIRATNYNGKALYDTINNRYPNSLYLSRDLSYEQRQEVEQEIHQRLKSFNTRYYEFLRFLKYNYPEAHLSLFVGW